MERLVPLTKILMTLAVSVWAILLRDWVSLLALVVVELGPVSMEALLGYYPCVMMAACRVMHKALSTVKLVPKYPAAKGEKAHDNTPH